MNAAVAPPLWCLRPGLTPILRQWGRDLVLYSHTSGETHALDPATAAVYITMLEHPAREASAEAWLLLMGAVDDAVQGTAGSDEAHGLVGALNELSRIGLVEQRPS